MNFERDESNVADAEVVNDGREECRDCMEDHGSDYLRWRRSYYDGSSMVFEIAD